MESLKALTTKETHVIPTYENNAKDVFSKDNKKNGSILFRKNEEFQNAEFTYESLEEAQRSTFIAILIPFYINSKGRVALTRPLFEDIIQKLGINHILQQFTLCFRLKIQENDFAHPSCFFRKSTEREETQKYHLFECFYGLRYPVQKEPDPKELGMQRSLEWSFRPLVIHNTSNHPTKRSHWLILGATKELKLSQLFREAFGEGAIPQEDQLLLHCQIFSKIIAHWKLYLGVLYDAVLAKSNAYLFLTYEDFEAQRFRRDLKDLEDYIFDLPLMLLSMRKTAKALSFEADLWERRHDIACPPGNESQIVFRGIVDEIDLLIKRVDILEKRVKTLSGIYQDTLSHEIAKDTKNDSSAVRIITMITVLFLPATFVATFFSMAFIHVENSDLQVSGKVWVYVAITIPLTCLTLGGYYMGQGIQNRLKSRQANPRTGT